MSDSDRACHRRQERTFQQTISSLDRQVGGGGNDVNDRELHALEPKDGCRRSAHLPPA